MPAGVFLLSAVVGFGLVAVIYREDAAGLIRDHWAARQHGLFAGVSRWSQVPDLIMGDYLLWILALPGLWLAVRGRRLEQSLPAVWLIVVSVVLFSHRPAWWHYKVMFQVPLAWLAAMTLNRFIAK